MRKSYEEWNQIKKGMVLSGQIFDEEQLIGDIGELIAAYHLRRWFILSRYLKITPTGSPRDAYPVLIPVHTGANRLLTDRIKRLTKEQRVYLDKLHPVWDFVGLPYELKIGESFPYLIEVKTSKTGRFKYSIRDVFEEIKLNFRVLYVNVDLSKFPKYKIRFREII